MYSIALDESNDVNGYGELAVFARYKRRCDLAWQINLEVDSDDVAELLQNQELTIDELIEMHKQEQEIEELESLDPVQSENRMMVENLTEGLSF
ncbi:hypothetical protein TNCV_2737151 [Trichonephila clavipes]|nr:hypothetical protein TNCV_2737151 [Trichonephila clavipes]